MTLYLTNRIRNSIIVLILAAPAVIPAQEYGVGLSHHQLGIAGSMLSGYGLTYSYIFDRDFRIKTTAFAFYEDHTNSYNWTALLGLEFQYTFESSSITRFYGILGGYYYRYYNNYSYPSYIYDSVYTSYNSYNREREFALGAGIGLELLAWKHIVLNLDGLIEYSSRKNSDSYGGDYPTRYFGPGIGAGINYRF